MDRQQNQKNNMYKKVLAFFGNFVAVFSNFKRLTDEIEKFADHNKTLDDFIKKQRLTSIGVTGEKGNVFARTVELTVRASRRALVYAKDQDDETLIALFDVRESDFYNEPADEEMAAVKIILDALKPIGATLVSDYGVDAPDIPDIDKGVKAYEAIEGEPGLVIAATKAATKGIKDTMFYADESLVKIDDLLINTYLKSNPGMVDEYENVRLQDNIGIRHTGIYALLVEKMTGKPIEDGLMKVIDLPGKEAISDIDGSAKIETMKPGKYPVEFSREGYKTATLILDVIRGEHLDVKVEMEVG